MDDIELTQAINKLIEANRGNRSTKEMDELFIYIASTMVDSIESDIFTEGVINGLHDLEFDLDDVEDD